MYQTEYKIRYFFCHGIVIVCWATCFYDCRHPQMFGQISSWKLIQGIPIRAKNIKTNKTNDLESVSQYFYFHMLPCTVYFNSAYPLYASLNFINSVDFSRSWIGIGTRAARIMIERKQIPWLIREVISTSNDARGFVDWWNPVHNNNTFCKRRKKRKKPNFLLTIKLKYFNQIEVFSEFSANYFGKWIEKWTTSA